LKNVIIRRDDTANRQKISQRSYVKKIAFDDALFESIINTHKEYFKARRKHRELLKKQGN